MRVRSGEPPVVGAVRATAAFTRRCSVGLARVASPPGAGPRGALWSGPSRAKAGLQVPLGAVRQPAARWPTPAAGGSGPPAALGLSVGFTSETILGSDFQWTITFLNCVTHYHLQDFGPVCCVLLRCMKSLTFIPPRPTQIVDFKCCDNLLFILTYTFHSYKGNE